jgi:hypothetical protein
LIRTGESNWRTLETRTARSGNARQRRGRSRFRFIAASALHPSMGSACRACNPRQTGVRDAWHSSSLSAPLSIKRRCAVFGPNMFARPRMERLLSFAVVCAIIVS